jgi:hypothetical protein
VAKMADHYMDPMERELDLLKKITAAFQMAMDGQRGVQSDDPSAPVDLSAFATT